MSRTNGTILATTLVVGLVVTLGGCASGGNGYAAYPTQSGTLEDVLPAVTAPALDASGQLMATSEVICDPVSIVSSDLGLDVPVYRATDADFNEDGDMDPQYFNAVAWDANVGSVPYLGAKYATYMYGHYSDFRNGAFNGLEEAKQGDVIELTFSCRANLSYTVVGTEKVPKDSLGESELYMGSFEQSGYLVLTTCDTGNGTHRGADGYLHADDNLVVVLAPNTASAG